MPVGVLVISICGVFLFGTGIGQKQSPADTDVTLGAESGVLKIGGSHENLPPCKTDGRQIVRSNTSCIYRPEPPGEERRRQESGSNTTSEDRGVRRGGAGDIKGLPGPIEPSDPYDRHGRYWLVPPFLIGASSVIVLYIAIHCLYLHCYAKRKIRQMAGRAASTPAIVFSDGGDGPSVSSIPSFTPVVTYDGASPYGRTDLRESQPFIVYQPTESPEKRQRPASCRRASSSRRRSGHLRLPAFLGGKNRPRSSVCSESAAMETSTASSDGPPDPRTDVRRARASICLVPVCRTISDPTGGANGQRTVEWTPLQGLLYPPSVVLSGNASATIPGGTSFSSLGRDDANPSPSAASPFVFVPDPLPKAPSTSDASTDGRRESVASKTASTRMTAFVEPEAEMAASSLTSHPEVETLSEIEETS